MALQRDPIGTPDGFAHILLEWGDRVRVQFCDGRRAIYRRDECIFLDKTEKPSASVTVLDEYRKRMAITEAT